MHLLGINWNPNETLFHIGFLQIKYYNLLWIVAFALGWFIMKKIFENEKKSMEELDSLFIYTVLSTMLGARLGHVFFYDWEYYQHHLLEILLPIKENPEGTLFGFIHGYEFSGFAGLASHGAAIGVIIGMYLFTRKHQGFTLLWLLDRLVIPVSIGAFLVRLGNFFNSEINGKITTGSFPFSVRFIRDYDDMPPERALAITKAHSTDAAYKALEHNPQFADVLNTIPFRHPAQLYEGICYIVLFVALYLLYWKTDKKENRGYLFGLFLVALWTIRFLVEFVKKSQGGFEKSLGLLSTGQWLSIPFILIGLYLMYRATKAKTA